MEQVEKLVHLYQLRKNMELNIILDFSEEAGALRFIPLVLMTMVENIFKHGNVADKETGVQIYVGLESNVLIIETINAMNFNIKVDSTHAGLRNVTERLHFAYGSHANCSFEAQGMLFRARMEVPVSIIELQSVRKGLLTPELN